MMAHRDLLIPNLAAMEVENALKRAVVDNEAAFESNREQLVDFYVSQQNDEDSYQKEYFNKEIDSTRPKRYPHNLILAQLNITGKVIDKKAKCYLKQPVRLIDGKQSEVYDGVLYSAGIKTASKLMDRMTWLLGDHCIILIADKDKKSLRIDQPTYYIPLFEPNNNVDPVGVVYPSGWGLNKAGDEVQTWTYWDETQKVVFENNTWNVMSTEENPHKTFNAIFTHRLKPFRGHWTKDAQDLVDANRDVNIALTSINNAFRYQGFPSLAFVGIDEKEAGTVRVGFDQAIAVSPQIGTNEKADVKFVGADVDWDKMLQTIKSRIELVANTWNVDIQWEMRADRSSGIALKILTVDNRDDIDDMAELYEEYFELPLFRKVKEISKNITWMKTVEGERLTIDWPEWETIESAEERMLRLKTDLQYNLTNPIREMMRDNPDLSEAQATEQYKRNVEKNKELGVTVEPIQTPGSVVDKRGVA